MQRLRGLAVQILLVFALVLALSACGPEAEVAPPAQTAAPPPAAAPQVARAEAAPAPAATTSPKPEAAAEPTAEATPVATATHPPQPPPSPPRPRKSRLPHRHLPQAFHGVRGIVDPSNFGWPREVEGLNGVVSIPFKPLRIITASVGHDEMTLAIVPLDRLVAVGGASKDQDVLQRRGPASGQDRDLPRPGNDHFAGTGHCRHPVRFSQRMEIVAVSKAGIPVIQTELKQGPEARINSILLMGYIYGEEERAIEFATEVRERYEALIAVTGQVETQPRVLASHPVRRQESGQPARTPPKAESFPRPVEINVAAEAGIEGNQTTSLEGVIAMNPEVIVIAQPVEFGAEEFRQSLLDNEALAELPAVKERGHLLG